MKKVYCNYCKHHTDGTHIESGTVFHCCHAENNLIFRTIQSDYLSPSHEEFDYFILPPSKKNKDNDCKDFEAK